MEYFISPPPLAIDGLDYSLYVYNDSVGETETVNVAYQHLQDSLRELLQMQINLKIPYSNYSSIIE
jgi:hypothetical protein